MHPAPEEFKDLGILSRKLDGVVSSFDEAAVECCSEVAAIEAQNAFEDLERAFVFVGADFDANEPVEHLTCGNRSAEHFLESESSQYVPRREAVFF